MKEDKPQSNGTNDALETDLQRAIADYEARLTALAEIAAHVRHEVNNPLTGLIGQSQLLLRENLSENAQRRVKTILHLAERIRDTVAELRGIDVPKVTR